MKKIKYPYIEEKEFDDRHEFRIVTGVRNAMDQYFGEYKYDHCSTEWIEFLITVYIKTTAFAFFFHNRYSDRIRKAIQKCDNMIREIKREERLSTPNNIQRYER